MVRRAAASKLGDFAKVFEEDYLKTDLFTMFEELAKDEQVVIRRMCIASSAISYFRTLSVFFLSKLEL